MVTRLTDRVNTLQKHAMNDPGWRQMVYDHRLWLKDRASVVTFTLPDAHQWRFRLKEWLKAKYNMKPDTEWIVFYLNNLENIEYDGGVITLLVPTQASIEDLYSRYSEHALML